MGENSKVGFTKKQVSYEGIKDMVEIFELREVLEALAVRLFVTRRNTELIGTLNDLMVCDLAVHSHRKIMDAILKSDAGTASQLMAKHVVETKQYHIERYYML